MNRIRPVLFVYGLRCERVEISRLSFLRTNILLVIVRAIVGVGTIGV
jgi:hypothetical protein